VVEQVVIGKLLELAGGRIDEALLTEAQRGRPQPRHTLQITPALIVFDEDAVSARHDDRTDFGVAREVRVRVHEMLNIERCVRISTLDHRYLAYRTQLLRLCEEAVVAVRFVLVVCIKY
jgi:hypothetical protein